MRDQPKISGTEWLALVGKDRLQAYQDNYARLHEISLVFTDLDGNPITVWSNQPLLCVAVAAKSAKHCNEEMINVLRRSREKGTLLINNCFLGMAYFVFPVYYNHTLVAFCHGGGVVKKGSTLPQKLVEAYHIPRLTEVVFTQIARTFQQSIRLLDIDADRIVDYRFGGTTKETRDVFGGRLSKREREVAMAICKGMSNKEISETLFISEKTVKTHVSNILLKLDLNDRVQLVLKYCRLVQGMSTELTDRRQEVVL